MNFLRLRDSGGKIKSLTNEIAQILKVNHTNLSKLHEHITVVELNEKRMAVFKHINSDQRLVELIRSICSDEMRKIVNGPISYQVKINVSIHMPYDRSSVLSAHCDSWAGDSPYQVNVWIPLTKCYQSNSMFIVNRNTSLTWLRAIANGSSLELIENSNHYNFIEANVGDAILFNGNLFHGNVCNVTNSTRVSINYRMKHVAAPEYSLVFPDRSSPFYYMPQSAISGQASSSWRCFDMDYTNQFIKITHGRI